MMLLAILSTCLSATLYEVLEVTEDASDEELRKSFRKLSSKYHPDRNPGDEEAHKLFL
jgi:DnaJ-class molecular chaperone